MKIMIVGNLGYVGPLVESRLRASFPNATLIGYDIGYFAHCLTNASRLPEVCLDAQHFGDIRNFPQELLEGVDAVVNLAAISNDPMGNNFEQVTLDINHAACVELARKAKAAGVPNFVFLSSCSVYGYAEDGARVESSPLDPLTAYARSKVQSEVDLAPLAGPGFQVTCLRFATACGMSDRIRLDLVLNDFVAGAIAGGRISILSDGTPWRPLIHVQDMARAVEWAIRRDASKGGHCLIVNAGSDGWNYQVKDLAMAVADAIPGVEVTVNPSAAPDRRSYRVDFTLFKSLAPDFQPQVSLSAAVKNIETGLRGMGFDDPDFRKSHLMRLNTLNRLRESGELNDQLRWSFAAK